MLEFFSERQELSIQNMSIKNLRVQIMQPRSKYYKVENENNMEYFWLPPGLSKKITVRRIHQEDEQDSYDLLPIRTESTWLVI